MNQHSERWPKDLQKQPLPPFDCLGHAPLQSLMGFQPQWAPKKSLKNYFLFLFITLPETNSKRPWKWANSQKETKKYSNHPFSGAFAVSFREGSLNKFRCTFSFWLVFFHEQRIIQIPWVHHPWKNIRCFMKLSSKIHEENQKINEHPGNNLDIFQIPTLLAKGRNLVGKMGCGSSCLAHDCSSRAKHSPVLDFRISRLRCFQK